MHHYSVFKSVGITVLSLCIMPAVLLSCMKKPDASLVNGKKALVQVSSDVLYAEDVMMALPVGLTGEDSAVFAQRYIDNWIQDVLFYENAKRNVPDTREIEQLVENYRRSLYEHEYQRNLIQQKFRTKISQQQVDSFYVANPDLFILDHTVVKGLFLIVPAKSRDIARFRGLYTRTDDTSFEEIEKLSIRNAARCEFFYDSWRSIQEIEMMIPVDGRLLENAVAETGHFELSDNDNAYFLHVSEIVPKGSVEPLENVAGRIRGLLTNRNEVDYMRSVKSRLYEKALKDHSIIFFNNEVK